MVTVVYDLHHAPEPPHQPQGLEEFQRLLQPYVTKDKGRIEVSNRLNTLTIMDTKENIAYLEGMLHLIHHPDAIVRIEARVVEVRWDKELQIGMEGDLSAAAAAFIQPADSEAAFREIRLRFNPQQALGPTPFQGSTFRFNSTSTHRGTIGGIIQAFVQRGQARILSQPNIIVRSGETATIFAGERVPVPINIQFLPAGTQVTFNYENVGVRLEVTPHVAAPNLVVLQLKPEVSTILGSVTISPTVQAPQFTTRNASTKLIVRTGEEIVIGGLLRKEKLTVRRGIPFLSDIPILEYFFGKYEDTEVVQEVLFFIRPHVMLSEADLPRPTIDPERR